jgi:crotonobetainyl-CoA:carnitine CoA-transferase CaiB-like acyl-CoA transferase
MMLSDLGADVIKLEPPTGDMSRQVSDAYFASINRGKRSVVLDLTSTTGQDRLHELAAGAHALIVNQKPSAIHKLGLTYAALRPYNEKIVCVAVTGYGLYGGDDPAFDYVIQAAAGVAAMTGEPDGPPILPGYSAADNSAGLTAALGLLAQIISGRGGQIDVSLRDVMLSQLNYKASAYLNEGVEPVRHPFGAHTFYVPAQLFPTADGHIAIFLTHDRYWRTFVAEAGIAQEEIAAFPTMADRAAHRAEVVEIIIRALAADTARGWERRLRPRGVPIAAVRSLPEALADAPGSVVDAGGLRLVGSPIRIDGFTPSYGPAPALGEHSDLSASR